MRTRSFLLVFIQKQWQEKITLNLETQEQIMGLNRKERDAKERQREREKEKKAKPNYIKINYKSVLCVLFVYLFSHRLNFNSSSLSLSDEFAIIELFSVLIKKINIEQKPK